MKKTLFGVNNISDEDLINELKTRGYKIIDDRKSSKKYTNQIIIDFFYTELSKIVKNNINIFNQENDHKDLQALKRFQEKATRHGLNSKQTNEYLYQSLCLVFRYYDLLGLTQPILSLNFLLNRCSWVFNKAFAIHRQKMLEYETSEEVKAFKEAIYDDMDEQLLELRTKLHTKYLEN